MACVASSNKFCRAGDKKEKKQKCQCVTVNMEFNKFKKEKRIENARKIKGKLVPPLIRTIKEKGLRIMVMKKKFTTQCKS